MHRSPQIPPRNAPTPPAWLSARVLEGIKTDTLAQWPGAMTEELQARIAMALPDIIDELTLRRAADLTIVRLPSTDRDALRTAENMLRSAGEITQADLTWACQTVLQLSQDATLRNAASDVLSQLTPAA